MLTQPAERLVAVDHFIAFDLFQTTGNFRFDFFGGVLFAQFASNYKVFHRSADKIPRAARPSGFDLFLN